MKNARVSENVSVPAVPGAQPTTSATLFGVALDQRAPSSSGSVHEPSTLAKALGDASMRVALSKPDVLSVTTPRPVSWSSVVQPDMANAMAITNKCFLVIPIMCISLLTSDGDSCNRRQRQAWVKFARNYILPMVALSEVRCTSHLNPLLTTQCSVVDTRSVSGLPYKTVSLAT